MESRPYPSDVNDDEGSFVAPYLTLMTEEAPRREHSLRDVFNGKRPDRADGIAVAHEDRAERGRT